MLFVKSSLNQDVLGVNVSDNTLEIINHVTTLKKKIDKYIKKRRGWTRRWNRKKKQGRQNIKTKDILSGKYHVLKKMRTRHSYCELQNIFSLPSSLRLSCLWNAKGFHCLRKSRLENVLLVHMWRDSEEIYAFLRMRSSTTVAPKNTQATTKVEYGNVQPHSEQWQFSFSYAKRAEWTTVRAQR